MANTVHTTTLHAQEKGHCFVIDGRHEVVSADNPASCTLGGFKETTTAHMMCRQCLSTHEEFSEKVKCLLLYIH